VKPYYEEGNITLYHGDCLEVLSVLDESVDIVFTSPPYNLLNSPGGGMSAKDNGKWKSNGPTGTDGYAEYRDDLPMDEYEEWQRSVLTAVWERTTGAIYYNHKPRPRHGEMWLPLVLNPGLPLRQIVIWTRPGGINFNASHYVTSSEWIMIFARPDWKLKDQAASGATDTWYVPPENSDHPAPFPKGLPARAIETAAPSSILDPFSGSGTTLRAAKDAGIRGIGIELSERYCEMAANRLAQGSLFAGV
jgi:modification methylase